MSPIYDALVAAIRSRGFIAEPSQQSEEGIVFASAKEENFLRGNTFWVTCRHGAWILATWAPTYYRFLDEASLTAACIEFLQRESRTQPRLPEDIVTRFQAREISEKSFDSIGFA